MPESPLPSHGLGSTLCIIAGGGELPWAVAHSARAQGRTVVILGLSGEISPERTGLVDAMLKWGEIGRMFDLFKRHAVAEVILAGSVTRPDLADIRVDLGGLLSAPRLIQIMRGGDDAVLRKVIDFIEERHVKVVSVQSIAPELLAPTGVLTKLRPTADDDENIAATLAAARQLGQLDIGQGVIADSGRVIAVEGIEGTNGLLRRAAELRTLGRWRSKAPSGILAKSAKPTQDLRVDLPTIGLETIALAKAAGLRGIAVEAQRVLMLQRAEMIAAANDAGMFIVGYAP